MRKKVMPLAIFCLLSLNNNAMAQITQVKSPTVPTDVGTTKIPPGQYLLIEQTTGTKYSMTVTEHGTTILGTAPISAMSELQNFIK